MSEPRVRLVDQPATSNEHPAIVGTARRRSWVELSVALTAVVVSVASLFVSRHQAQVMDRQLAASVWPMMEYLTGNTGDSGPQMVLGVSNSGIGPARIRSFRVLYRGKPAPDAGSLLQSCCGLVHGMPLSINTSGVAGRLLQQGNSIIFLRMSQPPDTLPAMRAVFERLGQARLELDVRTCYCSVLGDCWTVSSKHDDEDPAPVSSCRDEQRLPQFR